MQHYYVNTKIFTYDVHIFRYDIGDYEDLSCSSNQELHLSSVTFGWKKLLGDNRGGLFCDEDLTSLVQEKLCTSHSCRSPSRSSLGLTGSAQRDCLLESFDGYIGAWEILYECGSFENFKSDDNIEDTDDAFYDEAKVQQLEIEKLQADKNSGLGTHGNKSLINNEEAKNNTSHHDQVKYTPLDEKYAEKYNLDGKYEEPTKPKNNDNGFKSEFHTITTEFESILVKSTEITTEYSIKREKSASEVIASVDDKGDTFHIVNDSVDSEGEKNSGSNYNITQNTEEKPNNDFEDDINDFNTLQSANRTFFKPDNKIPDIFEPNISIVDTLQDASNVKNDAITYLRDSTEMTALTKVEFYSYNKKLQLCK